MPLSISKVLVILPDQCPPAAYDICVWQGSTREDSLASTLPVQSTVYIHYLYSVHCTHIFLLGAVRCTVWEQT